MTDEEKEAIETLRNRTNFRLDYKCKKCNSEGVVIIPNEVFYGKEIDICRKGE